MIEGRLVWAWGGDLGEHLFPRRANLVAGYVGFGQGCESLDDRERGGRERSAEDGVEVFEKEMDQRAGDVESWRKDNADWRTLIKKERFSSKRQVVKTYHFERSSC